MLDGALGPSGIALAGGATLTLSNGGMVDVDVGGGVVPTVGLQLSNGTWNVAGIDNAFHSGAGTGTLIIDRALMQDFGSVLGGGITLNIHGSDDLDDALVIDVSGLDFLPTGGVNFVAGEHPNHTDNDSLTIVGYSLNTADGVADLTVSHTGPEVGSVELIGLGTIRFSQIEPLTLAGTAADLLINLPAGADATVRLSDDGGPSDPVTFSGTGSASANGTGNVSIVSNLITTDGDSGDGITMLAGSFLNAGSGTTMSGAFCCSRRV